jgi:RHS repeat-associated protein
LTEYDPLGRVKKVTNPDGTFTTTAYDHRLTTTTNENGDKKDYLADAFGRTIRVREYMNNALYATTQYGFDVLDRLWTTTDNAGNVTTLTYDWLGRKTQMQDPDMGTWTYAYDNAGNLTEQHDAKSQSVCFAYDDLNRVETKTARTGTSCASSPIAYTVTYGYDAYDGVNQFGRGRRTSLTDASGSQTWTYDKQGRVTATSQTITGAPATYTTNFTYDAMDRVRTMTYPDGEIVTTSYNNQGLPDTLNGANPYVSATTYNAASQLDSLTFGNGALTDYVYNSNNLRLTDIVTTKSGNPNPLLNLHYTFDNVGNILSVQDNARGETTNYTYDDLSRLLSANVTNGPNQYSRSWTYDAIGNISTRVEQGVTTSYQYNDATSKHAVTHLNNVLKYQYDANGNMISRDGDTLTYDVENRLTQVIKGSTTTNFGYNGDGARVKRQVVGVGTTYYIGNYFEVYVPNGGSATFNKYYYFGAQRVAAKIAGTLFYFQGDHLGSSSIVMTSAGTSFYSRQTYFPYGAQRITEGSALPTDYTFTGQKNDASTDLMFYGARYYDTTLGRFTQPDTIVPSPLNPQAFNRYSYGYNNPVRYLDPTGHIPCEDPSDCDSGGGDDQPEGPIPDNTIPPSGGGVPVADPSYCQQNPYANGCYDPSGLPATDDGGSNDDDNCNLSCQKEQNAPAPPLPPPLCGGEVCITILPTWTVTVGIGFIAQAGLGGEIDIGAITLDSNGTLQVLSATPGLRLSTGFGGGWDTFIMVTNAKSLDGLQGLGGHFGATVMGISSDYVVGQNHAYDGIRFGFGPKPTATILPTGEPIFLPGDIHAGVGYTFMSPIRFELW